MPLIYRTGYISAALALVGIIGYGVAQIMQVLKLISYPWDEVLIYGFSLCITVPFLVMIVALHQTFSSQKKLWSGIAVAISTAYLVFALTVYTVQLTIVLPAGRTDMTVEYLRVSPHSLFWALDALAYLCMGLATLFLLPALKQIRAARRVRGMILAHGIMTAVAMIVYFYPHFSTRLLLIASPWLLTACGVCASLAVYFRNGKTLYVN